VHGVGEPLLLVHPGGVGVDSRAFGPNVRQLSEAFRVYTPDRRGHGRTPDVDGPITYEAMAADSIEFIERIVGAPTRVLGMSDGAITALYVAMERPDLVTQLAFVAGVFHRDGWHNVEYVLKLRETETRPVVMALADLFQEMAAPAIRAAAQGSRVKGERNPAPRRARGARAESRRQSESSRDEPGAVID
jgi:pimeloyl-ACP methyl ester carboxylesterase